MASILDDILAILVTVVLNNKNGNKLLLGFIVRCRGFVVLSYLCFVVLAIAFSIIGGQLPESALVNLSSTLKTCYNFTITVQYLEFFTTLFILVSNL